MAHVKRTNVHGTCVKMGENGLKGMDHFVVISHVNRAQIGRKLHN